MNCRGENMYILTLTQLAGISEDEMKCLDDVIERLVQERNAAKIFDIVREYVNKRIMFLADKMYDKYLKETVMRLFTERFMILTFVTNREIEVHVFKKTTATGGVRVLKEVLPRK